MSPITHALMGWSVACAARLNRRERGLVTVAGVIPDVDGLGIVVDLATRHSANPTDLWGTYHHVLGHNLALALIMAILAALVCRRRWITAGLVLVSFHLHLLGDVLGARGPDGDQWPVHYLVPFTDSVQWVWSGQWYLNAWPNILITGVLLLFTLYYAWRKGISPVELVSTSANERFVSILRHRFGTPSGNESG